MAITLEIIAKILHDIQKPPKEILVPSQLTSVAGIPFNLCDASTFSSDKNMDVPGSANGEQAAPGCLAVSLCGLFCLLYFIPALQDTWFLVESGDFGLAGCPRLPGDCKQLSG